MTNIPDHPHGEPEFDNEPVGLNDPAFGDEGPPLAGDPHQAAQDSRLHQGPTINSINAATKRGNRGARVVIMLVVFSTVVGLGAWFAIHWLTEMKNVVHAKSRSGGALGVAPDSPNTLNPESTSRGSTGGRARALGADGVPALPLGAASAAMASGGQGSTDVRPLMGKDGKVMVNADGKAVGVDSNGRLVEVPAIGTLDGSERGKRPLPGQTNVAGGQTGGASGTPPKKPPSRYGGALLADGLTAAAVAQASAASETAASKASSTADRNMELLRTILQPHGQDPAAGVAAATGAAAQDVHAKQNSGPVASQLASSTTPVALASRMRDQTLLLPRDRQADCILTTRIINELPGMTSCTLTQNLYGADGKVILLERGSEISGEYGVSNQMGQRRLFVVWTRARTPGGVVIDLQSPGADPLGTSGVPGYLEQRWGERIGAALLLSVMKDTISIAMQRVAPSTSGSTVVVAPPGQGTVQAGQEIAEQVLKQTINVKPTLYINEGTRISIYVARDLDFSPVYALKTVASQSTVTPKDD